jgi:hypothetical protein
VDIVDGEWLAIQGPIGTWAHRPTVCGERGLAGTGQRRFPPPIPSDPGTKSRSLRTGNAEGILWKYGKYRLESRNSGPRVRAPGCAKIATAERRGLGRGYSSRSRPRVGNDQIAGSAPPAVRPRNLDLPDSIGPQHTPGRRVLAQGPEGGTSARPVRSETVWQSQAVPAPAGTMRTAILIRLEAARRAHQISGDNVAGCLGQCVHYRRPVVSVSRSCSAAWAWLASGQPRSVYRVKACCQWRRASRVSPVAVLARASPRCARACS